MTAEIMQIKESEKYLHSGYIKPSVKNPSWCHRFVLGVIEKQVCNLWEYNCQNKMHEGDT